MKKDVRMNRHYTDQSIIRIGTTDGQGAPGPAYHASGCGYRTCSLFTGLGESNSSLHSTVTVHQPLSSFIEKTKPQRPRELGQTSPAKSHKKVTFDDRVIVQETLHVNDFSEEEYKLYWITHEEQEVILNMADITTELMSVGASEDDEHICFRGLEGKTPEANQEYSDKYFNIIEAILIEQEHTRSYLSGSDTELLDCTDISLEYHHQRLADLYRQWTQTCKETAWYRAQLDEHEAWNDRMRPMMKASSSESSNR